MSAQSDYPQKRKDNYSQQCQSKYEYEEASRCDAQVPHAVAYRQRPQWEQTNANCTQHQQRAEEPVVNGYWLVNPHVCVVTVGKVLLHVHLKTDLQLCFIIIILLLKY